MICRPRGRGSCTRGCTVHLFSGRVPLLGSAPACLLSLSISMLVNATQPRGLRSPPRPLRWHRTRSLATRALHRDDLPPFNPLNADNHVQEIITIFTAEGAVHRIPGRRISFDGPDGALFAPQRPRRQPMPSWDEQTLCIGASFAVSATNGRDPTRRVHFLGFCQSVDYLEEAVTGTVFSRGGEVLLQERHIKSGVHEVLRLKVAIPFLFGVPPEVEALSEAIIQGGGILDKVSRQWDIFAPDAPAPGGPPVPGAFAGGGGFGAPLWGGAGSRPPSML
ncbi:MAG: hypothetical protein J3K34DRAFT_457670 [Monoraphidium minutum]|nr:MAG: hypothetical protein J3K34DRAFT_457670 [Monoraphidium minutum]